MIFLVCGKQIQSAIKVMKLNIVIHQHWIQPFKIPFIQSQLVGYRFYKARSNNTKNQPLKIKLQIRMPILNLR